MCGINHQACCGAVLLNKLRKNPGEDTQSAPADKTIVESFVWPILARGIFPLQAVLDDIDNAADDTSVIDSRNAMGTRKVAFDTSNLFMRKIKKFFHGILPMPTIRTSYPFGN